jgi:hypothetical protein
MRRQITIIAAKTDLSVFIHYRPALLPLLSNTNAHSRAASSTLRKEVEEGVTRNELKEPAVSMALRACRPDMRSERAPWSHSSA